MRLFQYRELKYYFFGLAVGISNLRKNGFRLGLKKTVGKLAQPVSSHARFPEYHFFAEAIHAEIAATSPTGALNILDVGSPKLLGLYLASKVDASVVLTDISAADVAEYSIIWDSLRARAKGKALFARHDARSLQIPNDSVDVAYSMSVIEHIEGEAGDSQAIQELVRVLKPGGLLIVSVPFGPRYTEQQRIGLAGAVQRVNDGKSYFFQRIYDKAAFRERLLKRAPNLEELSLKTVWRTHLWAHRAFGALGENIRGVLGFCNPILSRLVNRSANGIHTAFPATYCSIYSGRDVYGDLIWIARKRY